MKIKVRDEPGSYKLPDDYHVPLGLRTPPETTEQEVKDAQEALMDYDADHALRIVKRTQRARKHGSHHGGD